MNKEYISRVPREQDETSGIVLPPSPELVGLYIADLAAPQAQGAGKPPALLAA